MGYIANFGLTAFDLVKVTTTMRLSKIYTRVGDDGKTYIADGSRLPKDDLRVESYGNVDELNANLGMLVDELSGSAKFKAHLDQLYMIQNQLFDLGAELSTPLEKLNFEKQQVIRKQEIKALEDQIDAMNDHLKPLENFILPGGHKLVSWTHICRTVCRRAERSVISLHNQQPVREEVIKFLNRLSDYFFVLGRDLSRQLDCGEKLWQQRK